MTGGLPSGVTRAMLLGVNPLRRIVRTVSSIANGVTGAIAPGASGVVGSVTGPLNAAAGGDPDSPRAAGRRERRSARRSRRRS